MSLHCLEDLDASYVAEAMVLKRWQLNIIPIRQLNVIRRSVVSGLSTGINHRILCAVILS